jgi:hypothetical protein
MLAISVVFFLNQDTPILSQFAVISHGLRVEMCAATAITRHFLWLGDVSHFVERLPQADLTRKLPRQSAPSA